MKSSLGAIILAAGLSSRMGSLKALLKIDGETMISRVVGLMEAVGASPIVVVVGYRQEDIRRQLEGRSVTFVYNEKYAESQMMDSMILGFDEVQDKCERVLITPVDVPVVVPDTVKLLLNSDGGFVRPVFGGKAGHPVLLKTELIPKIKEYSNEGLNKAILNSGIGYTDIAVPDEGVLMESNTPEEFEKILEFQSGRKAGK